MDAGDGSRVRVDVAAALRLWARLAEVAPEERSLQIAGRNDIAWLGVELAVETIIGGTAVQQWGSQLGLASRVAGRSDVKRLARLDALHDNEYLLRLGWVLLAGTVQVDGKRVPVAQPLLTRPVTIRRRNLLQRAATGSLYEGAFEHQLELHGEAEVSRLVDDPGLRNHLTGTAEFGGGAFAGSNRVGDDRLLRRLHRLKQWIRDTSTAMGLPVEHMTMSPPDWDTAFEREGLRAHVGSVLYISRDPGEVSVATSLLNWSGRRGLEATALGAVLGAGSSAAGGAGASATAAASDVLVPMPLSPSQEAVVRAARSLPVTVLSGAPGTGKTHTLCAVAVDAVARGNGVLVATHSRAAADAVTELLDRTPGPDPVRFGEGSGIARVIDELEQRRAAPATEDHLDRLWSRTAASVARREAVLDSILAALQLEERAYSSAEWSAALPALRRDAPRLFEHVTDLDAAGALLDAARAAAPGGRGSAGHGVGQGAGGGGGWWARRRARRALRRLRELAGSPDSTDLERLAAAIEAAESLRALDELALGGGTRLGDQWSALVESDESARRALGEWLEALPHDPRRLRAGGATALSDLLTALKAGRGLRRDLLASLPAGAITAPVPLWVGTLGDIEDVLPAVPGLFDLVILDEASHIEQSRAAGALLRGKRALVVGDPRQLRHTSFMSDERLDSALDEMGLTESRAVLDVRRVTAFDLAAAVGEPIQLREHFRSEPHLIGFSLSHFYRDEVAIMTTSPSTETTDCIDVVQVPPSSPDAVVDLVSDLVGRGVEDIGIITPFREHAEDLEELLGKTFDTEEIRRLRLRVGTVHGFQGAERDVMVIASALSPQDPPGRRRFVEEPHLFNVMITRARHRCIVTTSLAPDVEGLLGQYIRYAERGPLPQRDAPPEDPWTRALADGLAAAGLAVRAGYSVGPWTIDLLVGGAEAPIAVETRVHPFGPAAHVNRRITLSQLGWRFTDAYPSRWDGHSARAVVELADELAALTR